MDDPALGGDAGLGAAQLLPANEQFYGAADPWLLLRQSQEATVLASIVGGWRGGTMVAKLSSPWSAGANIQKQKAGGGTLELFSFWNDIPEVVFGDCNIHHFVS
jgi:hypothetical protein